MYYRVAIQMDQVPAWRWKSTLLNELSAVFHWLRLYRALPPDRLRVFSSATREELDEQLARENQGLESTSVTAEQFLHERMVGAAEMIWGVSSGGTRGNERTTSIALVTESPNEGSRQAPPVEERGVSFLERRRTELERGAGGDHDCPYRFTLPLSMPQVLAWLKLMVRIQHGDLQP